MEKNRVKKVLSKLPPGLAMEIGSVLCGRVGGMEGLDEIRLILGGTSSIVHMREPLGLSYSPTEWEMEDILSRICDGGTYAHRDSIKSGYVPLPGGVRVGVSGRARYEGGKIVGVSRIRTLVFRFPLSRCDFEEKLERIYKKGIGSGMLIYSPPAVGKTTALRKIAEMISRTKRLCIIDERGEFDGEDLPYATILSGYEKALGIEIALRTHSPEVIMVDELGAADTDALNSVIWAGVPLIATVHGGSISDIQKKPGVRSLIEQGAFTTFVGISKTKRGYKLERVDLKDLILPKCECEKNDARSGKQAKM